METKEILQILDKFGDIIWFFLLVLVGFVAGTIAERMHYASLRKREAGLLDMAVATTWDETLEGLPETDKVFLVTGCCVVSQDYFKRILASLKNIFGGRLGAYETLIDRGRREATLRMKESAKKAGCDMVIGMKLESAAIGDKTGQGIGCVEIIAYGTAIKFKK
jgi:uncharacterized protein YbjQ (UPF0145 family)